MQHRGSVRLASIRLSALLAATICGGPSLAAKESQAGAVAARPVVGAIRWDGWNACDAFTRCLQPRQWQYRLPFFARVEPNGRLRMREDRPGVIDQEITFAAKAGLDYWAFVWYHPDGWPPESRYMQRCFELYLKSETRDKVNYALILSQPPHLGPRDRLGETIDFLVDRFRDANYQKVLGGRPLVFFYLPDRIVKAMGSTGAVVDFVATLRARARKAGAGDPYFTGLVYWPPQGVRLMDELSFDAFSTYAFWGGSENREHPYSALEQKARDWWAACLRTGRPFIPTVSAGWDYRPMKKPAYPGRDMEADWFAPPTPEQLADHVNEALVWTRTHTKACPAQAILIYAWNELSEGGWLVPTLKDGTARLDALSKVLKRDRQD